MQRGMLLAGLVLGLLALAGCGQRAIRIDLVPVTGRLQPVVVQSDQGMFIHDKVALINISGTLSTLKPASLLSDARNPVADLREQLDAISHDDSIKAVVLRMDTPGGTVTASDMMYRDLLAFKAKTHKPVVVSMLDVCASGGYYVSCAADYRYAYPTTITGSIGVIVQTMSFAGTLNKLGITAEAVTSGPHKDMLSPFKPIEKGDLTLVKKFVEQFYGNFLAIVKKADPKVPDAEWSTLADGRIITGTDAAKEGLIDATGTVDDAIAKAKELAGIKKAKVVEFTRDTGATSTIYSKAPNAPAQMNMVNVNLDTAELAAQLHPQFLYMWMGQ